MISHPHRCIFIHIPKTAGSSIARALGGFEELAPGVQDHRTVREFEPVSAGKYLRAARQGDAWVFRRDILNITAGLVPPPRRIWQRYFKFSFVRNPWARIYSWYANVIRDPIRRREFGASADTTLAEFVEHCLDHFETRPQMFWLKDTAGQVPLDFVGRFESLQADWDTVCRAIGAERPLPHLLHRPRTVDYRNAYDAASRDRIALYCAEEIETFGYRFEQG
jgi:hypothetical protein